MENKETFTKSVLDKAKELKVTPKLLLMVVVSLAENINANEEGIIKHYFKALTDDMKEAANTQTKSRNPRSKEAGLAALTPLCENIEGVKIDILEQIKVNELMPEGCQTLHLHYFGRKVMVNEFENIRSRYSSKTGEVDIVHIIKNMCPDLIEKAMRFCALFSMNDLNFN